MQNNKSFFQVLREHKQNNTGFLILMVLSVLMIGYTLIDLFNSYGAEIQIIFLVAPLIISAGFALYYEYNKLSFVAHLIFFIGLLEPYIRNFYQMIFQAGSVDFLAFLITLIGTLISIYAILKMIAHNREIKNFIPSVRRNIMFLLALVLINLYLLESLESSLVLLLMIVAALFTGGAKMTLPLVLMVYITKIVDVVHLAYLFGNNIGSSSQTNLIINSIIYVLMIYYTIRLMREEDNVMYS